MLILLPEVQSTSPEGLCDACPDRLGSVNGYKHCLVEVEARGALSGSDPEGLFLGFHEHLSTGIGTECLRDAQLLNQSRMTG